MELSNRERQARNLDLFTAVTVHNAFQCIEKLHAIYFTTLCSCRIPLWRPRQEQSVKARDACRVNLCLNVAQMKNQNSKDYFILLWMRCKKKCVWWRVMC